MIDAVKLDIMYLFMCRICKTVVYKNILEMLRYMDMYIKFYNRQSAVVCNVCRFGRLFEMYCRST